MAGGDAMNQIQEELLHMEVKEDARILYACESGSRAWGFPSQDSDYDVRFLYARRPEWYLSIDVENRPDVFERPISDSLDISGWDLRKALRLLRKSNPPLLEWFNSPIVYMSRDELMNKIRSLVPDYYSPIACHYHYLQMAKGNFKAYLTGEFVSHKKYFYVLRPLLAIKWIEEKRGPIPVLFSTLVNAVVQDAALKNTINELIERKKQGLEADKEPRIEPLSNFIEQELARWKKQHVEYRESKEKCEKINDIFRSVLKGTWDRKNPNTS